MPEEAIDHMSFLDGLYERLVNRMLEKLSHMKNVKAPLFVDNYTLMTLMATAERAKTGLPLSEPLGSSRDFRDFQDLMFVPAMFPSPDGTQVNTTVTLGRQAKKPLVVPVPFMVSAYGYGVSVSKEIKVALAKGATLGGTATNSGEGGYLREERQNAQRYIVQYNRAGWGNRPEELSDCDMVEIRMGQGASAGAGYTIKADDIGDELMIHLGLNHGQDAVMPWRFPGMNNENDLRRMVRELKEVTQGSPIALKIAAGDVERDLATALHSEIDVIVLDGAQAGTASSPEITINNFGVPTLYALVTADRYLRQRGVRDKVSLIVAGGIRDAGDVLKAVALGADAVYLGYAVLFSLIYTQLEDLDPGTSPLEMEVYTGKQTQKLNIDEAAESIGNFLRSTSAELSLAIRCMGKSRLDEVTKDDLVALSREISEITGVRLAYEPQDYRNR
jgi:glutamate synthase domain-containing protein 2